jgi:ATP-dependent DNA helicase RecG
LDALVQSADGFVIAEEDLRIRGPGEFFGVRQWGLPEFRAANLIRDSVLLEQARREAFALLDSDPHLAAPRHQLLRAAMLRKWQSKLALGSVS